MNESDRTSLSNRPAIQQRTDPDRAKNGPGAIRPEKAANTGTSDAPAEKDRPASGQTGRPSPAANDEPKEAILGTSNADHPVGLDLQKLLGTRMLIQGSSGSGKSHLLRRLAEQSASHLPIILVDPEGEFGNLAEHIAAPTIVARTIAEHSIRAATLRARENHLSLHIDLSDTKSAERIEKAAAVFESLVESSTSSWNNTTLVIVDEAHLLAPHLSVSTQDSVVRRMGVTAMMDLCSRGRKRGLCPILATQRLNKLATSVTSELQNIMIGLTTYEGDIKRAMDLLGYNADEANALRELEPGFFHSIGPAISRDAICIHVGPTKTKDLTSTPELRSPTGTTREMARTTLGLTDSDENTTGHLHPAWRQNSRALENFILHPHAAVAARAVDLLRGISPNATTSTEIGRALGIGKETAEAIIDLLSENGLVNTIPQETGKIVRLSSRIRVRLSSARIVGLP